MLNLNSLISRWICVDFAGRVIMIKTFLSLGLTNPGPKIQIDKVSAWVELGFLDWGDGLI
jgi:hypothetical protein